MRISVNESAVLLVAETPDASSTLAAAVSKRVKARRSRFTLLVPAVAHGLHRVVDPEDECCEQAEQTMSSLRPSIEAAAGETISTMIGSHEPLAAIEPPKRSEAGDAKPDMTALARSSWPSPQESK